MDVNKARETELRQLRKEVSETEEQNAVLQKHVDTMESAIGKLEGEIRQQQENNQSLNQHVDSLRRVVVKG